MAKSNPLQPEQSGPATPHPDYQANKHLWLRVRDCHDGEDAVKGRRTTYLPKPGGMEPDDYSSYLMRAGFLPAVERTEEVLSGLLFREPPEVEAPPDLDEVMEDVTLTGQPLEGLAQALVVELLVTGRVALLLDFATPGDAPPRPYWSIRSAESFLSWQTAQVEGGEVVLTRAAFSETALVRDPDNPYGLVPEQRVREYVLTETGVVISVYAFRDKDEWVLTDQSTPKLYGEPLREIPVLVAAAREVGFEIDKPPLLPIANLSLSHYRTSADREQGNYYASLPTAYVTGAKLPKPAMRRQAGAGGSDVLPGSAPGYPPSPLDGFRLGSNRVLELPEGATMHYLEISGPGLDSIHKTLEMKKADLESVGARLVRDQQRTQETAQTARIKAQADASLMRLIANVTDQLLTKALRITARWMKREGAKVSVKLNRGGLDAPEPAQPTIPEWPTD